MFYQTLRSHYRRRGTGPVAKQIAPVLNTSTSYAKKCLATGCFTVTDKYRILHDLRIDIDRAGELFPPLGE